jgi:hypothetical protein
MTRSLIGEIISVLTATGYAVYAAVRGYRNRRPYWSRQSWWRFGASCAFGTILLAMGLAMAAAVDLGIFKTTITSPADQDNWMRVSLALLIGGAVVLGGMLSWFALGDPEQHFPGVKADTQRIESGTA